MKNSFSRVNEKLFKSTSRNTESFFFPFGVAQVYFDQKTWFATEILIVGFLHSKNPRKGFIVFAVGIIRLFFVYSFESFDTWMLRLILTQCKKCWNYKFLCRTRLYLVVERNLIGADFDHVLGNDCASSNQQNTKVPKTYSLFTNRYQKFSRWMVCLRGVLGSKLLAREWNVLVPDERTWVSSSFQTFLNINYSNFSWVQFMCNVCGKTLAQTVHFLRVTPHDLWQYKKGF